MAQAALVLRRAVCSWRTVAEFTEHVPRRAMATMRLREAVVGAVIDSGRAVSETARAHAVSWWLVQAALTVAAVRLPDVGELAVTRIGVDEHRYRSVRYFGTPTGGWRRFEPWMLTIVNLETGQVLGVVDGRDSVAVGGWLAARSQAWRDQIEIVAIDPSAAFRRRDLRRGRRPLPPAQGWPQGSTSDSRWCSMITAQPLARTVAETMVTPCSAAAHTHNSRRDSLRANRLINRWGRSSS